MPRSSDTDGHQTPRLVEAGEILRTLSPPTLATLHLLIDSDISTQSDMADIIGCARPTVSRYLQSLEDLPMSLARKQGHNYTATEAGDRIFGLIESMLARLGTDLRDVEWSDDEEREEIEDNLSPLYDSRSTWPFLILESIRSRVNFLNTPEPVSVEDVIIDVRSRQRDIGKSVTAKQIRKTLWRFDEKQAIEFDGSQITLTDPKGQQHVRLLHQLIQILEEEQTVDVDESTGRASSSKNDSSTIANLLDPRQFRGGSRTVGASQKANRTVPGPLQEPPTIVPAYYLIRSNDAEPDARQTSELSPMLPFTSLTVDELSNYANQLKQEYGGNAQLEPYWALRTEDGLSPLGPAQLTLGTLNKD
jgi:DNA-binding MarR family transcriptional regulator